MNQNQKEIEQIRDDGIREIRQLRDDGIREIRQLRDEGIRNIRETAKSAKRRGLATMIGIGLGSLGFLGTSLYQIDNRLERDLRDLNGIIVAKTDSLEAHYNRVLDSYESAVFPDSPLADTNSYTE